MLKASPMSADPAIVVAMLSCSRCDGPVLQEDLAEGVAVRVDGQPVCALCVESLPPALRLQINRARALKGLAVTTYRMAMVRHPQHHFYTFTSAGLLLLHRRALVHGTEFATPDLPPPGSQIATTAHPAGPPAAGGKGALWWMVGGAAVAAAGVAALLVLTSAPGKAHNPTHGEVVAAPPSQPPANSSPLPTSPSQATVPAATAPAVLMPVAPADSAPQAVAPVPAKNKTANEYLHDDVTAYEALLAAERDGASADTVTWLTGRTHADREAQLRMANKALAGSDFEATQGWLDKMPLPAERSAFTDLVTWENTLRQNLEQRRRVAAQTPAAAVAAANPTLPPAVPDGAPNQPPAPTTVPAETPATVQRIGVTTPAFGPGGTPPVGTGGSQPVTTIQPPTATAPGQPPAPTQPAAAGARPQVITWSGALSNPKLKATMLTEDVRFPPSPWPTVALNDEPRFIESEQVPEKGEHALQQLTFQVPGTQVANGGITLLLHRGSNQQRKALLVTLQDAQPVRVALEADSWAFATLPVSGTPTGLVTVHIEDEQPLGLTFWLGPVALVRNGTPDEATVGLLPSALVAENITTSKDQQNTYVKQLKHLAKLRGTGKEPATQLWFSDVKVVASEPDKDFKTLFLPLLKERMTHAKMTTANTVEEIPLAHLLAKPDDLYTKLKNPPTTNQTLLVIIPNGSEATLSPEEWLRAARALAGAAVSSEAVKAPRKSCIPVFVMGTLDGAHAINREPWKRIASNLPFPLIDLELGDTTTAAARVRLLIDALDTLALQYRYVQRTRL